MIHSRETSLCNKTDWPVKTKYLINKGYMHMIVNGHTHKEIKGAVVKRNFSEQ